MLWRGSNVDVSATDADLTKRRALQRSAQWRVDFINTDNSMGLHAPQEAARILAEAVDLARQGQLALIRKGFAGIDQK